jgi:hypothetical protein
MRSRFRKMSPRQATIWYAVAGVLFVSLGVWVLITGTTWIGVSYLLVGVFWLVIALLAWRKPERVFRNPERA